MNIECIKFFLFAGSVFLTTKNLAQTDCRLRKEQDSIKVYTCFTDTSRFKLIKAEFKIHTSLEKLEKFLLNFSNYTTWQYNTVESRVIKKISDTEYIYYAKINAPWPVTDRDMVVRLAIRHIGNYLYVSAHSTGGVPIKKELVRVPSSHSEWIVTETSRNILSVKYVIQIDPGGNVPAWIVNWVSAIAPYQSFKELKKQMSRYP
ncbi:MAG: hypothetical protein JST69_11665 [Bacteroidetes bacterium]|nr:hypothetical protein [Bacteroidota bacterium]